MRIDFCHTIRDERLGIVLAHDVECELEISFEMQDGEPSYSIDGVYIDDTFLLDGEELAKLMGAILANAAEDEMDRGGALLDAVLAAEGVVYRGMGAGDPDGRHVRVRS